MGDPEEKVDILPILLTVVECLNYTSNLINYLLCQSLDTE